MAERVVVKRSGSGRRRTTVVLRHLDELLATLPLPQPKEPAQ